MTYLVDTDRMHTHNTKNAIGMGVFGYMVFHTKIGVKLCSMAGGGVSRNLWNFFRTAPAGTGQAVTCSTSGMGLRLK